jgi:hypothetical protein
LLCEVRLVLSVDLLPQPFEPFGPEHVRIDAEALV